MNFSKTRKDLTGLKREPNNGLESGRLWNPVSERGNKPEKQFCEKFEKQNDPAEKLYY